MRYENPMYMAEDAGAADIISGGRLQLGISRGSPEQVIDGWRYFGYVPPEGETDADMARRHTEVFLEVLRGQGFAKPNPRPMFANPPGLLRLEPYSEGLRERIWWGAGSSATAEWAGKIGMNLQSSTLVYDETGEPLAIQQAGQIRKFREAWKAAGHTREPRVSVSRSIFALMDDRDRAYFGRDSESEDTIGFLGDNRRAVFGRSYAAEPDVLVEQLKQDEAIAEADTLLVDGTKPARRRLQRPCHRGGAQARRPGAGMAVMRRSFRCVMLRQRFRPEVAGPMTSSGGASSIRGVGVKFRVSLITGSSACADDDNCRDRYHEPSRRRRHPRA